MEEPRHREAQKPAEESVSREGDHLGQYLLEVSRGKTVK